MNILHVVNGNDFGGATTQVMALIKGQSTQHAVSVLAIGSGKIVDWCQEQEVAVRVYHLKSLALYKLVKELQTLAKSGWIIHVHGLKPMVIGALAKWRYKKDTDFSLFTTIHSNYYLEYKSPMVKSLVAISLIRFALKKLDIFFIASPLFTQMLEGDGVKASQCFYIANGIDFSKIEITESREVFLNRYQIPHDDHTIVAGIAARIHKVKGLDVIIEAASHFKGQNVQFIIAGSGDDQLQAVYQEQINALGLAKQVHLIGYLTGVYNLYNAIDINLLASHSEGLSYSVLEGSAMGKPLVCTNVTGMMALIEPEYDGLVVPIADSQAFADALSRLVTDEDLRSQIGERIKNKVRQAYNNEVMAQKYLDIYGKYLDGYTQILNNQSNC